MKTNDNTYIWQLTIAEFKDLIKELIPGKHGEPEKLILDESEYVHGIAGLAELIGASKSKAQAIKSSGIINEATVQIGRKIIIHKKQALQILKKTSYVHNYQNR